MSATRMSPSLPGWVLRILAKGQVLLPRSCSLSRTISPGMRFLLGVFHLVLCWRPCRYSWLHRVQRSAERRFTRFHRLRDDSLETVPTWVGGARNGQPMRKCPGVRAEAPSEGVESIGRSGLLLSVASVSASTVVSSSKERWWEPTIFFSKAFIDFTPASQRPPKWLGEKLQSMWCWDDLPAANGVSSPAPSGFLWSWFRCPSGLWRDILSGLRTCRRRQEKPQILNQRPILCELLLWQNKQRCKRRPWPWWAS